MYRRAFIFTYDSPTGHGSTVNIEVHYYYCWHCLLITGYQSCVSSDMFNLLLIKPSFQLFLDIILLNHTFEYQEQQPYSSFSHVLLDMSLSCKNDQRCTETSQWPLFQISVSFSKQAEMGKATSQQQDNACQDHSISELAAATKGGNQYQP